MTMDLKKKRKIAPTLAKLMALASSEYEVKFKHKGKDYIAVFDVSGGHAPGGSTPETHDPGDSPEVEFLDAHCAFDPSDAFDIKQLSAKEIENLEEEAIEKYIDDERDAGRWK